MIPGAPYESGGENATTASSLPSPTSQPNSDHHRSDRTSPPPPPAPRRSYAGVSEFDQHSPDRTKREATEVLIALLMMFMNQIEATVRMDTIIGLQQVILSQSVDQPQQQKTVKWLRIHRPAFPREAEPSCLRLVNHRQLFHLHAS